AQAAVPHHLFGSFGVAEPLTCVGYAQAARAAIAAIHARGRVALLVGGTGLYLRTLFEGLAPLPETPPALRSRLTERARHRGRPALYRLLRRLDREAAALLHPNDSQRVQRFLEVRLASGRSITDFWR